MLQNDATSGNFSKEYRVEWAIDTSPQSNTIIAPRQKTGIALKMGGDLAELYKDYQAYMQSGQGNSSNFVPSNSMMQTQSGRVLVDVVASGDPNALLTELQAMGFEATGTYGRVISGYLPMLMIDDMMTMDKMQFTRPVYRPITNAGQVVSQANTALRADVARQTFAVDGTGVTVGVLSDSFNNLGGATADTASSDLPATVNVLQEFGSGGSDEGRAMLQLIRDVAPGANLSFATAFNGQASFANNIINLAAAGADVLVDDVIYLSEPFFQDGIIAQAIDQVVSNGVAYFSAAGNNGRQAYESPFRASGRILTLNNFQLEAHDFDPGAGVDIFQRVTIPVGSRISLSFQWDSPFFSAGGTGSSNDLDILLFNRAGTRVLAGSADPNVGNDPVEIFDFVNDGSLGTEFNIAIGKFAGANPGLIKYVGFGDLNINEFNTASGTLYGHANARGAQAVGAAFFANTPAFGTNPATIEPFSAAGTTPILFNRAGNRLATPDVRLKPEIVAPDGTNTSFFGFDTTADADTFPNFFGTSAAAPHAAAVAALLLDLAPNLTPADIYSILQQTALDMDDPNTIGFDSGFDPGTGFGLIQADRALQAAFTQLNSNNPGSGGNNGISNPSNSSNSDNVTPGTPNPDAGNDDRDNQTFNGTPGNDDIRGTANRDIIRGNSGRDRLSGLGGNDQLVGGDGNDQLFGGNGNDQLRGERGNDRLDGGNGKNRFWGGQGRDIFILSRGNGEAIIQDFDARSDRLQLPANVRFADITLARQGNNTLISLKRDRLAIVLDAQVTRSAFITLNEAS